jgi:DNA N-6-adenine-methyltransferase (Dam)
MPARKKGMKKSTPKSQHYTAKHVFPADVKLAKISVDPSENGWVDDPEGTPREVFQALDKIFHFTLDAAASKENALCRRYYDQDADGLRQSWSGERVYCNPPPDDPALWVSKAIFETELSACPLVVMVLPADGDWNAMVELHGSDILDVPPDQLRCVDKHGEVQPVRIVTFKGTGVKKGNGALLTQ